MNDSILHSTLRELRLLAGAPRLWVTFGAVVLLFAIIGPYETATRLGFLPRFAYWLLLHAAAWSLALTFAIAADVILRPWILGRFKRMLVGSAVAALPISAVIQLLDASWFGTVLTVSAYLEDLGVTAPLCLIFCVISYLTLSGDLSADAARPLVPAPAPGPQEEPLETRTDAGPELKPAAPPQTQAPLVARLRPENRGALRHISVEDHYTRIRTTRGHELVLLRFSDALKETGSVEGLRVHRSHWVARASVTALRMTNGRLSLVLEDGTEVPVSRSHAEAVRAAFR